MLFLDLQRVRLVGIWCACFLSVFQGHGAVHPDSPEMDALMADRKKAWVWQPIHKPSTPPVQDQTWAKQPVDRFILRTLESHGLKPAPPADAYVWLRRVHLAITGLPPSPDVIREFVLDTSPGARERMVDRLLASPHYGERWARHWMDLMRFAESYGHEQDYSIPHAWRYRDYLIRAFNADIPYAQLVREHLAGDLLVSPRRHPEQGYNESLIATGFWYLHQATHAPVDPDQDEADRIDNQIDVFSKAFLGLTVACARCHDHKFDPISTRDYYSLTAFLRASRQDIAYLDPDGTLEPQTAALREQHASNTSRLTQSLQRVAATGGVNVSDYLLASHEILQGYRHSRDAVANVLPELYGEDVDLEAAQSPSLYKRPVALVAQERGLNPDLLQRWVTEFLSPHVRAVSHPLNGWWQVMERHWGETLNRIPPPGMPGDAVPPEYQEFLSPVPEDWFPSGQAFQTRPAPEGSWSVTDNGLAFFPVHVVHSGWIAREVQGTLRSPSFVLTHTNLHLRLAGTGGQVRLIIERYGLREFNPLLFERTLFNVNSQQRFAWYSITSDIKRHIGRRAYLEFIDSGQGALAFEMALFSNSAKPPVERAQEWTWEGSLEESAFRLERLANDALRGWLHGEGDSERLNLLSYLSERGLIDWGKAAATVDAICDLSRKASQDLKAPLRVLAITDGSVEPARVFVRGDPKHPGAMVSRRSLEAVVGPQPMSLSQGSGRLQWAETLLLDSDPLVYRVIVNRVWAHLFGRGLVPTVDNFGALGQPPSHPELLDFLASAFRESGGSIKSLVRTLCLSRTFAMSSALQDARVEEADPDNVWLHRMRLMRMEGEAVRDSLLAVSGSLDPTLYGPSVPTYISPFMGDRMWVHAQNGPMDGARRRSLYQETRRNFLSIMMLAFDLPLPDTTVGRRNVSNVPAQSLVLMNDPFVRQQAEALGRDAVRDKAESVNQRIETLYLRVLGRPPRSPEMDQIRGLVQAQAEAGGLSESARLEDPFLWAEVSHVLFMLKEFIHVL